jgi:hypothetical protein
MTGQSNQQKHLNSPTSLHSTSELSSRYTKGGLDSGNSDDDDADDNSGDESRYLKNNSNSTNSSDTSIPTSTVGVSSLLLPSIGVLMRLTLGVTVALYILNQKHLLPRPVSKIVSHVLFWPTLPITISKRLGKWFTPIDDTIIMGGAPFGFAQIPELLYEQYNVRNFIPYTTLYPCLSICPSFSLLFIRSVVLSIYVKSIGGRIGRINAWGYNICIYQRRITLNRP